MLQILALKDIYVENSGTSPTRIWNIKHRLEEILRADCHYLLLEKITKLNIEANLLLQEANSTGTSSSVELSHKAIRLSKASDLFFRFLQEHQDFPETPLLESLNLVTVEIQGLARFYEIHSFVRFNDNEVTVEHLILLMKMISEFLNDFWETNPEEVSSYLDNSFRLLKLKESTSDVIGTLSSDDWVSLPGLQQNSYLNDIYLRQNLKFTISSMTEFKRAEEELIKVSLDVKFKIDNKRHEEEIERDIDKTLKLLDSWKERFDEQERYESSVLIKEVFGS